MNLMRHFTLLFILLISVFSSAENMFWQTETGTEKQMATLADTLTEQNCSGGNAADVVNLDHSKFKNADDTPNPDPALLITPGMGDPKAFCDRSTNIQMGGCGWAKSNTPMYKIGEAEKKIYDADSKSYYKQKFLKVKYCYYREVLDKKTGKHKIIKNENEGWVGEDSVVMPNQVLPERPIALPPPDLTPAGTGKKGADPCPDELSKAQDFAKDLNQYFNKETVSTLDPKKRLDHISIADKLSTQIGECPLDNPSVFGKPWPESNNVYDAYVLPKILAKAEHYANETKGMLDEDGKPVSLEQIIAIDALARTLFGEMGICHPNITSNPDRKKNLGTHYAETVAKILVNRDDDLRTDGNRRYATSRFLASARVDHDPRKPTLAMVATTPGQLSFWNRNKVVDGLSVKNHSGLAQGLCPPSRLDKPFGSNLKPRKPTENENSMWRDFVRIATRAVLFRKQFSEDTKEITVRHYTSSVDINRSFPKPPAGQKPIIYPELKNSKINSINYTPFDPSVVPKEDTAFMDMLNKAMEVKPISNPACLRLWDDKPERQRLCPTCTK